MKIASLSHKRSIFVFLSLLGFFSCVASSPQTDSLRNLSLILSNSKYAFTKKLCSSCQCETRNDVFIIVCNGSSTHNVATPGALLARASPEVPSVVVPSAETDASHVTLFKSTSLTWQNRPITRLLVESLGELKTTLHRLKLNNCSLLESPGFLGDLTTDSGTVGQELPYLQQLSLAQNSLSGLTPDLRGFARLKSVDLSQNEFTKVNLAFFHHLDKVDISQNLISSFQPPIIHSSNKLRHFNMSLNNLSIFDHNDFTELTHLEVLDLSWNSISSHALFSQPFRHLHKLQEFYLRGNAGIIRLMNTTFIHNPNLRILYLDSLANLYHIQNGIFNPLSASLRILSLKDNPKLSHLHSTILHSLNNLSLIDLSRNFLNCRHCAVPPYRGKSEVFSTPLYNISASVISCSCRNRWVFEGHIGQYGSRAKTLNEVNVDTTATVCEDPQTLQRLPTEQWKPENFQCGPEVPSLHAPLPLTSSHSPLLTTARLGHVVKLHCPFNNTSLMRASGRLSWMYTTGNYEKSVEQTLTYEDELEKLEEWKATRTSATWTALEASEAWMDTGASAAWPDPGAVWRAWEWYNDEDFPGRVTVTSEDELVIKYFLKRDFGAYRCAYLPFRSSSRVDSREIRIAIDFDGLINFGIHSTKVMSIIVGFATAFCFLFITVTTSVVRWAITRCFKTQQQNKYMRQFLENVEWYKAQQLERYHTHLEKLRETYSSECDRLRSGCTETVERMRENCNDKMERIRENCIWVRDNYSDKMGKFRHKTSDQMERFREGASFQQRKQVDRIRDYSSSSVGRIREVSTAQTEFLREIYVAQLARLRDLSNIPMGKLRDAYKQQQMLIQKIIENLTYLGFIIPSLNGCRNIEYMDPLNQTDPLYKVESSDITTLGFHALGLPVQYPQQFDDEKQTNLCDQGDEAEETDVEDFYTDQSSVTSRDVQMMTPREVKMMTSRCHYSTMGQVQRTGGLSPGPIEEKLKCRDDRSEWNFSYLNRVLHADNLDSSSADEVGGKKEDVTRNGRSTEVEVEVEVELNQVAPPDDGCKEEQEDEEKGRGKGTYKKGKHLYDFLLGGFRRSATWRPDRLERKASEGGSWKVASEGGSSRGMTPYLSAKENLDCFDVARNVGGATSAEVDADSLASEVNQSRRQSGEFSNDGDDERMTQTDDASLFSAKSHHSDDDDDDHHHHYPQHHHNRQPIFTLPFAYTPAFTAQANPLIKGGTHRPVRRTKQKTKRIVSHGGQNGAAHEKHGGAQCKHENVLQFKKRENVFYFCKDCEKSLQRVKKKKLERKNLMADLEAKPREFLPSEEPEVTKLSLSCPQLKDVN